MSLPPGRYVLDANDDTAHGVLEREIILTGDKPEIDLGTLKLSQVTRKNINEKIKQSQTSGAMRDYTKHYGEELPAWHIVDASHELGDLIVDFSERRLTAFDFAVDYL